ncbi:proline-rich receptor-like protein kinase PERK12 [Pieris rapae]|uniref:proline-rich receptor-like protein kinase PERK12 n=1 Tax=Pieris rapae TaxID=64459 RepID=UPI001E27D01E|nr:proline-rich receptor-like protein kinase PERK12 [Pieris rapae]
MLRPRKHTTPLPFAEADAMATRCLLFLCITTLTLSEPIPGRIPKVYNALITSNQNLEPSKAYPVYQPVLRNTFPYPIQPLFYGDFPFTNSLLPPLPLSGVPKELTPNVESASPSSESPKEESPSDNPSEASSPEPKTNDGTEAPPPPPKTESPIPLNEFGLPPQVLPLGNFGSGYEFTQINTFPYSFPGLRFYDPYDPFLFNPYANFPLYRPLTNALAPLPAAPVTKEVPKATPVPESSEAGATPPSEPSDLNILNYSAKDPAIPNVPPPPLPQGGLKPDTE